jgi:hypothetical protein
MRIAIQVVLSRNILSKQETDFGQNDYSFTYFSTDLPMEAPLKQGFFSCANKISMLKFIAYLQRKACPGG